MDKLQEIHKFVNIPLEILEGGMYNDPEGIVSTGNLFVRKEVLKSGRLRKPEHRSSRITQEESTFSNGG